MNKNISFWGLFFEVWIRPRKVIRTIVDNDPRFGMWILIFAYSVILALTPEYYLFFLDKAPLVVNLLVGEVVMVIFSVLYFFYFTWGVYKIGNAWGGKGSLAGVKAAYAWCFPPAIIGAILGLLYATPLWQKILSGETNIEKLTALPTTWWQICLSVLCYLLLAWTCYPAFVNLAEVLRISVKKSFAIGCIVMAPIILAFGVVSLVLLRIIQAH